MGQRWRKALGVVVVQLAVVASLVAAEGYARYRHLADPPEPRLRSAAWLPGPLHNDPRLVSDEQLWQVLDRLQPRFKGREPNVNYVEHALRVWGPQARFEDPECMSGQEMLAFLTDHRRFESAYEEQKEPLIIDADGELDIHVGRSEPYASLHHDHLLACVLEGGVSLEQPVRSTRRTFPLRDLVRSALLNFRVDQGEYEWTTMLAAYCLGQQPVWRNDQGRRISFDLLARRLLRSADRLGVCAGTHRLYAMAVLLRLQQGRTVLSEPMRRRLWGHLKGVSRRLAAAQRADGCWTRRWWEGAAARTDTGTLADNVLATGHHLEWMSIAPESLLPPRTNLIRAGQWLVHAVGRSSDELIRQRYTFYSHVIGALANWRSVRPYSFYRSYPLGRLAQTRAVAR